MPSRSLSDDERARGVWTISAGNAGQGVAYAARAYGIPCTVVAIETAPQTKLDRMRALGATIVPVSYDRAWVAAETHEFHGLESTFIHPFDNHDFIAGHGTMGLEILEDCPECATVIAAIGGGGLITGVGSAIKARKPDVKVLGAEPETAAPYALSLREGGPRKFSDWQASFVDGAGGKSVTERMWQRMRPVTDGAITVTLDQTREAMRLIAEKARTIAEGRGRAGAGCGADRRGGRGADRLRGLGRQYRPRQVRRAGDRLKHPDVEAPGGRVAARQAAVDHQRLRRSRSSNSSDARNSAARAISSGSPPRPSGLSSPMRCACPLSPRHVVDRPGHAGFDEAGADGVDAHAGAGKLLGRRLDEIDHARLRG